MEEVGTVVNYFSHIEVAAVELTGSIAVGDKIKIMGHTTDFEQEIESMQVENEPVEVAGVGQDVGIKVSQRARKGDKVFKVTEE